MQLFKLSRSIVIIPRYQPAKLPYAVRAMHHSMRNEQKYGKSLLCQTVKEVRKKINKKILGSDPASGPAPEVKWIRSGPRHILRPSFLEMCSVDFV